MRPQTLSELIRISISVSSAIFLPALLVSFVASSAGDLESNLHFSSPFSLHLPLLSVSTDPLVAMPSPSKEADDGDYRDSRLSGREQDGDDGPSTNLWVGNLSMDTIDSDLMTLFAKHDVLDCVMTFSSRNFAFLYFKNPDDAKAAKDDLQGALVRGNSIKIEFARPVRFPPTCSLLRFCFCNLCTTEGLVVIIRALRHRVLVLFCGDIALFMQCISLCLSPVPS